jgi:hypothetical protein
MPASLAARSAAAAAASARATASEAAAEFAFSCGAAGLLDCGPVMLDMPSLGGAEVAGMGLTWVTGGEDRSSGSAQRL